MRRHGSLVGVVLFAGLAVVAPLAHAQGGGEIQTIWRCTDANGKTHVTNVKDETTGKDCKVIQTQRVNVLPPQAPTQKPAASKSPAGFPKESSGDRANARDRQKATLASELAAEEALLAKAKAELTEQESIRLGDERNYAKVLERLQKYKDNVELHEKNAAELRKELGKLK
jgi:hypothetical protein